MLGESKRKTLPKNKERECDQWMLAAVAMDSTICSIPGHTGNSATPLPTRKSTLRRHFNTSCTTSE